LIGIKGVFPAVVAKFAKDRRTFSAVENFTLDLDKKAHRKK
jgi:hypothetical protein